MKAREIAQYLLATVVVVGFFSVLALMLHWQRAGSDILIGSLSAAFGGIVGYFFGSSASSARKDEIYAARMEK